jgi:hypothetical protein
MTVKIYADRAFAPDKQIGRIDEEGKVYAIDKDVDNYIGWIDYEEGDVYDENDILIGWAEDDGTIIAYYEKDEEEEDIGYINDEGEVYYYDEKEDEVYFGKLKDWEDYSEGAAALLFFTEGEE